ncbi:MAG: hypothetical protein R2813_02560 [Flavobacteriales bacterium]
MRIAHLLLISLVLVITTLGGCRKKRDLASWSPEIVAPLAYGRINLADYAPEEYIAVDNERLVHFIASDTLINLGLDTIIGIPDYSVDTSFLIPIGGTSLPPGLPFLSSIKETKFPLKDVRLTHAIIRESTIKISMVNKIKAPVLFIYEIASATLNGDTFRIEKRIEANSSLKEDYHLDGYTLNLRGSENKSYNTVSTKMQVMIHPDEATSHMFTAGESVDIKSTVADIIPQYVVGYFGNQIAKYDEKQSLTQFSELPFEEMNITDFDIVMTVDNGIGADLGLVINALGSQNTTIGRASALKHDIIGSTQQFTRAINLYDDQNPVKHIRKTISFTDENSNLDELLEIKPDQFTADLSIEVNPLGNISRGNDFAYYGHNLTALMDLDIPLVVSAKGLRLIDTVAFEFDRPEEDDPTQRLNSGNLRFIIQNAYPFEAGLQFYLLDQSGVLIDSLMNGRAWVDGAFENEKGLVDAPVQSIVEIPIDQTRIDNLDVASLLKADVRLNTVGTDSVHIRTDGYIDFKVVTDLSIKAGKIK